MNDLGEKEGIATGHENLPLSLEEKGMEDILRGTLAIADGHDSGVSLAV